MMWFELQFDFLYVNKQKFCIWHLFSDSSSLLLIQPKIVWFPNLWTDLKLYPPWICTKNICSKNHTQNVIFTPNFAPTKKLIELKLWWFDQYFCGFLWKKVKHRKRRLLWFICTLKCKTESIQNLDVSSMCLSVCCEIKWKLNMLQIDIPSKIYRATNRNEMAIVQIWAQAVGAAAATMCSKRHDNKLGASIKRNNTFIYSMNLFVINYYVQKNELNCRVCLSLLHIFPCHSAWHFFRFSISFIQFVSSHWVHSSSVF